MSNRHGNLIIIVTSLFVLAWMSMKISLPILPVLVHALNTQHVYVKLSVTLFFLCFGGSQLFWGVLGDLYGRRINVLIGLVVAMLGTIIIIMSTNVSVYILGRCLEGVGMGSISPLCRAILTDTLEEDQFAKTFGTISFLAGLMPALAPLAGGYILVLFGWKAIFVAFLLLLLCMCLWVYMQLYETFESSKREKAPWMQFIADYVSIIKQPIFISSAVSYVFLSGASLGYYASMPFWFVQQWHMSEDRYAYLALFSVAS